MDAKKLKRLSHRMSALLRHRAGEVGLPMDAAGWVDIGDLLGHLRASRQAMMAVVADNNKTRYEIDGRRIRASQGHSLEGMPVTQEALEASWSTYDKGDAIWHGTRIEVIDSIAEKGLLRGGRTHVHLAASPESRVGKRATVAVLLAVSPEKLRAAGIGIFVSPNGVILARHVPPAAIVDLTAVSRRSQKHAPALRAALGL